MSTPSTEAGKRLLNAIAGTRWVTEDFSDEVAAIEAEARRDLLRDLRKKVERLPYRVGGTLTEEYVTRRAVRALLGVEMEPESSHVHEWVDARNYVVKSGEVCPGCGAIRAVSP